MDSGTGTTNTSVLTLQSGILTINGNETLVVGSFVLTGGSIAFGADGGVIIVGGNLWAKDADADGYPETVALNAQINTPTNGVRANTIPDLVTIDCDDTAYNNTNCCPSDYFGDGSDGALNVVSGTTVLDTNANPGGFDYTSVTVASGAVLTATGSNPLLIRSTGAVDIQGTLHVNGGSGGNGGSSAGAGGVSIAGVGGGGNGRSNQGNGAAGSYTGGGGGGIIYRPSGDVAGGGAGGSFGSLGKRGNNTYSGCTTWAQPGPTYGSADLSTLEGGSGGGGGGGDSDTSTEKGAGGGAGGGAVQIAADTVSISGNLTANGGKGGNHINVNDGEAGAGGGGSGGAIKILSTSITGTVSVSGGTGGTSQQYGTNGGKGGVGRISEDVNLCP
jgi:hypothetical protein